MDKIDAMQAELDAEEAKEIQQALLSAGGRHREARRGLREAERTLRERRKALTQAEEGLASWTLAGAGQVPADYVTRLRWKMEAVEVMEGQVKQATAEIKKCRALVEERLATVKVLAKRLLERSGRNVHD